MKSRITLAGILVLICHAIACEKVLPVPNAENVDIIGLPVANAAPSDSINFIIIDSVKIIECPEPLPYNELPDPNFEFYTLTNDSTLMLFDNFQIDNVQTADLPIKLKLPTPVQTELKDYFVCQIREMTYQTGFLMAEVQIQATELALIQERNLNWFYAKSNFITAGIHFTIQ